MEVIFETTQEHNFTFFHHVLAVPMIIAYDLGVIAPNSNTVTAKKLPEADRRLNINHPSAFF